MTITEDTRDAVALPRGPNRRRWVVGSLVGVVLVAVLVCAAVLWRISADYSPLTFLGWFGPQPHTPDHLAGPSAGMHIAGPAGTVQHFEFAIRNDGDHPLVITRVTPVDSAVRDVAWAAYRPAPNRLANGVATPSQIFPAQVSPHAIVKIRMTVAQPNCAEYGDGVARTLDGAIEIHWHAMISSHITTIDPGLDDYLQLCRG